jgi:hypothetical protein
MDFKNVEVIKLVAILQKSWLLLTFEMNFWLKEPTFSSAHHCEGSIPKSQVSDLKYGIILVKNICAPGGQYKPT